MEYIKEFVREEVKNRNGKRVQEVTGTLYARLISTPNGEVLAISYLKRNRLKDAPEKGFENGVLYERAVTWHTRLANDKVLFRNGQIVLVRDEGYQVPVEKHIPYVITLTLPFFIRRALRYYQGVPLTPWAVKVLELFPILNSIPLSEKI